MLQQTNDARLFAKEISKYLDTAGVEKRMATKVNALFSKLARRASGENTAIIESAVALTQSEKRIIEKHFAVIAEYRLNPELLTGLKIHVGEFLIDTSGQTAVTDLVRILSA
jgi:F0F1-type ATP synthase delta subunit